MASPYKTNPKATHGLDWSGFHPDCGDAVALVMTHDGLKLYCKKCRVLTDMEAVSDKICCDQACECRADVEAEKAREEETE